MQVSPAREPGDLGIPSSIRRYDLAVYNTQAIRDCLLRGQQLTVYITGLPYEADLQESLHDPESRSAGRHSFTGTLDGGGAALLTVNDSVFLALFRIGGVEYYVESTRQHDTVSPKKVLHYVYYFRRRRSGGAAHNAERLLPHAVQHQQRGSGIFRNLCKLD